MEQNNFEAIMALVEQGLSIRMISKRLSIQRKLIAAILRQNNVQIKPYRLSNNRQYDTIIIESFIQGKSIDDMAVILQVGTKLINGIIKRLKSDLSITKAMESNRRKLLSAKSKPQRILSSKKLWQNVDYKEKMHEIMNSEDYRMQMIVHGQKLANNNEWREKLVKASNDLWRNRGDEIKDKIRSIKNRKRLSDNAKLLWNKEAYRVNHATALAKSTYRQYRSDLANKLWSDTEFRTKLLTKLKSPEIINKIQLGFLRTKLLRSEITKQLWQNPEYREKQAANRLHAILSKPQIKLYNILDQLGIVYSGEGGYGNGEHTQIGPYAFDCVIKPGNNENINNTLLIECNGDYWRALENNIRRDQSKLTYINNHFHNHEIIYLWEDEFKCIDKVRDKIMLLCGIKAFPTIAYNLTDVVIDEVSNTDKIRRKAITQFIYNFHYLNTMRGGKVFVASVNDQPIACAIYSPQIRQQIHNQFQIDRSELLELSRFCIHPSYQMKNLASWFLARTIKKLNPTIKVILSYADTTVGHVGTIYKAANFQFHHTVPADYWYKDATGWIMHKKTLYDHAKSLKMRENDYAELKGFIRVYGSEKLCYCYYRQ